MPQTGHCPKLTMPSPHDVPFLKPEYRLQTSKKFMAQNFILLFSTLRHNAFWKTSFCLILRYPPRWVATFHSAWQAKICYRRDKRSSQRCKSASKLRTYIVHSRVNHLWQLLYTTHARTSRHWRQLSILWTQSCGDLRSPIHHACKPLSKAISNTTLFS